MGQFKFVLWLAYWYLQKDSYEFEWDTGNSGKSNKKHGVPIEEVQSVFELKLAAPMGRQISPPVQEERLCIIGPSDKGRFLSVVFVLQKAAYAQLARGLRAERKEKLMKKYAKRLKEYDKIEFDLKEVIAGMSRLKGARRKPTSIALEQEVIKELKAIAQEKGLPYQVLMRLLIADGLKRLKGAA